MLGAGAQRLVERLARPVDAASLAAFRILLGSLLCASIVRFWAKGVIAQAYLEPAFFFPYYGFSWVVPPRALTYPLFALLGLLGLGMALGVRTRLCAGLFCALFSYLHFVDVTHYLNHYYLVSLLTGLLAALPSGEVAALGARGAGSRQFVPAWVLYLFRFQIGVVYFFGGVAKLKADWLFQAQPLATWLAASTDLPWLGPLFGRRATAFVMSWLGAAYDLSIPFALLWRRTRPLAYVAVVAFHLLTARLFQIGLFPYLMIVGSLLFLPADWPRRLFPRRLGAPAQEGARSGPPRPWQRGLLFAYVSAQLLVPLRHLLYPGNVLWTEQGYRFAWNVMLIEKTGSAEFNVVDRKTGQRKTVFPRSILTRAQTKAMATQPDMILAFAHELSRRERRAGRDVAVYADVSAVLNGRPPRRLIDPHVDLTRERDGLAPKTWILPGP
jgi:vitamin K-dependent gamma-carboxylase